MTLNTRQVSFYMAQRNKGLTQEAAAATTGISVRSGRRIEKGQWQSSGERHWRTRQDPLEAVWLSDVLLNLAVTPLSAHNKDYVKLNNLYINNQHVRH